MIKNVTTTYNGGPREYVLAPKTCVVGPTGSGKTTLLASLGLLLTGHADDAIGRAQAAAGADLALAMADGQDEIVVRAESATGDVYAWRLGRGKRAVPWADASDWRHPVRELRRILSQGPDAARRDMAPLLLGTDAVELHRLLPKQVHKFIPASMPLDALTAKIEEVASDLKAAEKTRDLLASNAETLEQTLPPRPTPEGLAALKRLVATHREARRAVEQAQFQRQEWSQRLREELALVETYRVEAMALVAESQAIPQREAEHAFAMTAWNSMVERAQAQVQAQAQGQVRAEAPKPPFAEEQAGNLRAYVRILGLAQGDQCPLCKSKADIEGPKAAVAAYLAQYDAYEKALRAYNEAQAQAQTQAQAQAPVLPPAPHRTFRSAEDVRAEYGRVEVKFREAGQRAEALQAQLAALPPEGDVEVPTEDPTALLAAAEQADELAVHAVAKRSEYLAMSERAAALTVLATELRRVIDVAFRERSSAATEGVSRYLPKGFKMELMLQGGNGARVFRLGLRSPKGLEMNPSGGKRMALLLALAVWLIEQKRVDVPAGPVVVMPSEERAFSPQWLGKVMTALADAPVQIVICNLVKPVYRGKAWTTIELPGEDDEEGAGAGAGAPAASKKRGKKEEAAAASASSEKPVIMDWEDVRDDPTLRAQFADAIPVVGGDKADDSLRFQRQTPGGPINNCSLAHHDPEQSCQICGGHCPDREAYQDNGTDAQAK